MEYERRDKIKVEYEYSDHTSVSDVIAIIRDYGVNN